MKLGDLLQHFSRALEHERDQAAPTGLDAPLAVSEGRHLSATGTLHLYSFKLPAGGPPPSRSLEDVPVTVIPSGNAEPTEGFVLEQSDDTIVVQTFDAIGQTVETATIVPDTTAFFDAIS
ncbi:MAG: hypothetical protein ACREJU_12130, partial [Nitrospiraceae bacterium]